MNASCPYRVGCGCQEQQGSLERNWHHRLQHSESRAELILEAPRERPIRSGRGRRSGCRDRCTTKRWDEL